MQFLTDDRFFYAYFIAAIYFDMPFDIWDLLHHQIPTCLYLFFRLSKQCEMNDIISQVKRNHKLFRKKMKTMNVIYINRNVISFRDN